MISSKLVVTLLTAISGYTGYAIPGDLPHIETMPHTVLEQRVCGRPCQVYGFTFPDGEIVIDEALAVGTDPVATSILVHELTHFLQMKSIAHLRQVTAGSGTIGNAKPLRSRRDGCAIRPSTSMSSLWRWHASDWPGCTPCAWITPVLHRNNLGPKDEAARADCPSKAETRSLE